MDWGAAAAWLTGGLRAFVVLWSFALGASLGSFLNVVVYRLPAGLNLSRPKSRCPRCETPIRKTDNLPVLGWLKLRGRCRACGLPIAKRYPLVEATCGALLAALVLCVVLLGGVNLPVDAGVAGRGRWARDLDPELVAVCGALFLGQLALLAAGLTALDGHRLPAKLWLGGAGLAATYAVVWPGVRFAESTRRPEGWSLTWGAERVADFSGLEFALHAADGPLAVAVAVTLLCVAAAPAALVTATRNGGAAEGWNLVVVAGLAGAFFNPTAGGAGLTAGAALWFVSPALHAFTPLRTRLPGAAWLAFGSVGVPFVWRWMPDLYGEPSGPGAAGAAAAFGLLAVFAAALDTVFFADASQDGEEPANSATRVRAAAPPKQTATSDPAAEVRSG